MNRRLSEKELFSNAVIIIAINTSTFEYAATTEDGICQWFFWLFLGYRAHDDLLFVWKISASISKLFVCKILWTRAVILVSLHWAAGSFDCRDTATVKHHSNSGSSWFNESRILPNAHRLKGRVDLQGQNTTAISMFTSESAQMNMYIFILILSVHSEHNDISWRIYYVWLFLMEFFLHFFL